MVGWGWVIIANPGLNGGQATGHRVLTLQQGYTPKIKSHTHARTQRQTHAHIELYSDIDGGR